MQWRTALASVIGVVAVGVASTILTTRYSDPVENPSLGRGPSPATVAISSPIETQQSVVELRWGRAEITHDPEHWPPNRSDWSDEPSNWERRPVAVVSEIPHDVRAVLQRLDCAIPVWRASPADNFPVIWGEFERTGRRDLAVICVHSDNTSATYVFWGGDSSRRETLPQSGSSINVARRADMDARIDLGKSVELDMPAAIEHDGLEIGCCECCSTIFYRHNGRWFTLPGAD